MLFVYFSLKKQKTKLLGLIHRQLVCLFPACYHAPFYTPRVRAGLLWPQQYRPGRRGLPRELAAHGEPPAGPEGPAGPALPSAGVPARDLPPETGFDIPDSHVAIPPC